MADENGTATAALPQPKARTHRHSAANYGLGTVGAIALWVWWLARRNFCLERGADMNLGPAICAGIRADYLLVPAGLVILALLLHELHRSSRDLVRPGLLRPARAVAHSYRSLERRETIHLNASTLMVLILTASFIYIRFFSGWSAF